jgi:hypothetical protein
MSKPVFKICVHAYRNRSGCTTGSAVGREAKELDGDEGDRDDGVGRSLRKRFFKTESKELRSSKEIFL